MSITEFLKLVNFKPHGSVVNSWDSFNPSGSVLMQLWAEKGQRVSNHPITAAYLRVCCWNSASHALNGHKQKVGYSGRTKSITAIESGFPGYAALSDVPEARRGPGAWAQNANLSRVYPILSIERSKDSQDIFAILGKPIDIDGIK